MRRTITRRTILGAAGSAVLIGGLLVPGQSSSTDSANGGDLTVSLDEACSEATVEMHPPQGTTWTGVIEYREGGETVQVPAAGGQTVSGGSDASLQLARSSSDSRIERAVVVEGSNLDGPVVAEETCETGNGGTTQKQRDCGSEKESDPSDDRESVQIASGTDGTSIIQRIQDGSESDEED